jgi:hypothetical protein
MTITRNLLASAMTFAIVSAQLPAAAYADDGPVKVTSGDAARGAQTVTVGGFTVGFIFQSVDHTKATGGMIGAFGGVTSAKSELQGVTPAMMQAIADAAYADFCTQLSVGGFKIADNQAMFATPEFIKLKPVAFPYDAKVFIDKKTQGRVTFVRPSTLPMGMMLPGDAFSTGFGGISASMAAGGAQYAMGGYAKASGQSVVDVVYLIDFSNAHRPGAFSMGGIKVSAGLSVVNDFSKLSLIMPSGKLARLTINQPVAVEGDFASMADNTKGKAAQTAMNVFGGLAAAGGMGGMMFGKSRTYVFTANPEAYQAGATKAAVLANTRIIAQLAALR